MKNKLPAGINTCFNALLFFAFLMYGTAVFSEDNIIKKSIAENSIGKQLYLKGVDAYKNNDFNQALELFLQAQNAGYQNARLHYNIGITYFKLANYPQAYSALEKANGDLSIAFLVNLNTGLVANKLGKLNLARIHIETAYKLASGNRQKSIALYMLNKLADVKAIPEKNNLHGNILLSYGYIDNISLTNPLYTFDQTEKDDYFSSLYANLKYSPYNWLDIHSLVYALEYKDENVFDFADLRLLFMLKPVPSNRNFGIGLGFEKNYLADKSLQNIANLSIELQSKLDIKYEYNDISTTDDRFTYLSGSLQRLKFNLNLNARYDLVTNFFYEYEFNDRNDETQVIKGFPVFTSHSPIRHKLGLSTSIPINAQQYLLLNIEFQNSGYREASSTVDKELLLNIPIELEPDLLISFPDVKRNDRRNRTNVKWFYKLYSNIKLYLSYDYLSNQSNIEKFTYNSRRADMGLIWNY